MTLNYPINLIHCDGKTITIANEAEALKIAPRIVRPNYLARRHRHPMNLAINHINRLWNYESEKMEVRINEWIARDAMGEPVTSKDWPHPVPGPGRYNRYYKQKVRAAQLGIAIPRTGGRGNTRYYRKRRHVGDARQAYNTVQDLKSAESVSSKSASKVSIPLFDRWDSKARRDEERNWKSQRKTQWK